MLVAVKASSPAKANAIPRLQHEWGLVAAALRRASQYQTGAIELAYYGNVRQQTGENWDNVKLSLSTARPSVGARMPELEPWWLNFIQPIAAAAPRTLGYARNEVAKNKFVAGADADIATEPAPAPLEYEQAQIESSGVSVVFEIKIPRRFPAMAKNIAWRFQRRNSTARSSM